ncbi:MAG TPA: hypothetical protein VN759_12680, partial [Pseudolysinimonas sp.]|nr:hypothetical protein [Pseudolysinimonas sp.]
MRVGALAPLVLAALLLAGCSTTPHPDPSESQMKASAAHDELAGLLAQVQKVVGGDWQDLDTGAESCTLAGGGTGARYPFGRIGPGVPDDGRSAIVEQLSRLWTAAGMRPTVS